MPDEILEFEFEDAYRLLDEVQESQFLDFKSKEIKGKGIQKIVTAFANAEGGEVYVGIKDEKEPVLEVLDRWNGFEKIEDANSLIQNIYEHIEPAISLEYEFIKIKEHEFRGLVLKIIVFKSKDLHYTSDHRVYIRRSAQNLELKNQKEIMDLQLSKGIISYEDQLLGNYSSDELIESESLTQFLNSYSPKTNPEEYLKKQRLIRKSGKELLPTIASVLLYADLPSAILSKKCAIKITRYNTNEDIPRRENLGQQFTVEGNIYNQIYLALECVKTIINELKVLSQDALIGANYPIEAIQEILVNAVIHRDYNISDDIHIMVFDNRIEVRSPGSLPGYITPDNILEERFSRNPTLVRLLNKYPNPPNKDIGEGLNTAFQKMQEMRLKSPKIFVEQNKVIVILPHERLAEPEETVLEYLEQNIEINNRTARKLCGIHSENKMKRVFLRLRDRNLIEMVPGKHGASTAWRKTNINK
ncbi:RNA-binding domain-containing protein [Macrococcus carouselicus]|uniref:Transcriptional regulator n=1 Tax=Macrococcus carouselicus TaxID=69969 RepID=A0A9Q8CJA1_9STAP|nr:RNA-binding domain-containing protein [Macrococcus carouselicus]TDM02392.1 transcriptional regulator [Macrococcus carouselicus]